MAIALKDSWSPSNVSTATPQPLRPRLQAAQGAALRKVAAAVMAAVAAALVAWVAVAWVVTARVVAVWVAVAWVAAALQLGVAIQMVVISGHARHAASSTSPPMKSAEAQVANWAARLQIRTLCPLAAVAAVIGVAVAVAAKEPGHTAAAVAVAVAGAEVAKAEAK